MAAIYALCAAYVAYCLATNPAGPITTPDSIRYLDAWPNYPLGYPFFLAIFGARGAIIVQPIVFGASLAFLARELARLSRSTWLGIVVVAGCAALPQIREFHASILTESIFLSLGMVCLALAVRFSYYPTWHLMVVIAMTAGISVTVRRTGFLFLPLMLMMVLMQRHRLRGSQPALFFVAALAPFFVMFGIEQLAAPIVHKGHPSSLTGRHMFAKAALIDAPTAKAKAGDRLVDALNRHLENDYAPIREFLAAAPPDIRGVLTTYYETCLQGGCVDRSRELMPELDEAEQTKILGAVGIDRIKRAPAAFIELIVRNYVSLWTADRLHHPDRAARLSAFIAAHRPMPFEQLAFSLQPDQVLEFQPSARVRYMQWAITGLSVWTGLLALIGLGAIAIPGRFPPLLIFASTAALAAHGGLLLTALLASGFARFTLGLWPMIITAAISGVWAFGNWRGRSLASK